MKNPEIKIHQGKNVRRFREMNGLKQEALAKTMGEDWTQRKISLLEQKEEIEPQLLNEVAKALKVTPEAIKNFNDEVANNFINTFQDNSVGAFNNYSCTFNPVDKLVEIFDENKKLYEQLLQSEREKNELLVKTNEALQELLTKGKGK